MPCTTILVGKKASYDGSTIVARNEDSANGEFNPKRFCVVDPEGRTSYTSKISHLTVPLPAEDGVRYTAVPNADLSQGLWEEAGFSARGVAMSATETLTSNERVLGADPMVVYRPAKGTPGSDDYESEQPGGIGEEDMVTLVLPYAHSARDGVRILGELLERYGTYEMNGIAFSDVDEIWWLETVGGHHWIAKRVPDNCYVTMPNQLGIDSFDLADALGKQTEHMCSPDLAEWMAAHHLDLTLRAEGEDNKVFNPRDAFGSHSDEDHLYNTPRAWSMQRFLNPHAQNWDSPEAPLGPESDDLPWASVPERKVTVEDVKYVLSLHYQGTVFDPYGSFGTEATRGHYRPIGINRNSQLAVLQARPYGPEATRCVQWLAFGSNPFNALLPFYANVSQTPAYLEQTDPKRVSTESFYWANRLIAAMSACPRLRPTRRTLAPRASACWRQRMCSSPSRDLMRQRRRTFSRRLTSRWPTTRARRPTNFSPRCSTNAACIWRTTSRGRTRRSSTNAACIWRTTSRGRTRRNGALARRKTNG